MEKNPNAVYDVVSRIIHAMTIIELHVVNHTFKNSQLAVAMNNAALHVLRAAGFKDHK